MQFLSVNMADEEEYDSEEKEEIYETRGGDSSGEEEDDDDIEDLEDELEAQENDRLLGFQQIYYIEVVGKEQQDMIGPIDYKEFKQRYQDSEYTKLSYKSPMRDASHLPEWTQIFKLDHIFKDIDPQRYEELKSKRNNGKVKNDNPLNLAQAVPQNEMKERLAKEEEERLKNEQDPNQQRALIEPGDTVEQTNAPATGGCCIVM